jgi:hypothetical protein
MQIATEMESPTSTKALGCQLLAILTAMVFQIFEIQTATTTACSTPRKG